MSERKEKKKKLRQLLLFVPNLMRLLYALLKDPRVSKADKAILAGVIMYVIVPIDVIPDFVPFVGMVDDSYLIAISLLRLLNRANRQVVLDHWKGDVDIKQLVENISNIASYFLPERMRNALHGRIEVKGRLHVVDSSAPEEV
ncbi:MAG: YkvA family protein [Blastocatellia bacterium]